MTNLSRPLAWAPFVCATVALVGCSSPAVLAPPPPVAPHSVPGSEEPDSAEEAAAKPGPAYFGFKNRGVARLNPDGSFTTFSGKVEWVRDIAWCGGELWVADAKMGELYRASGTNLAPVKFDSFSHKPQQVLCTPDGETWGNASFGVVKLDKGKWVNTERKEIHVDAKLFDGMTLDASGRVWLYDRGGKLYRGRDESWELVATPTRDGKPLKPRVLAAGPGGAVFVGGDQGIFKRAGDRWEDLHGESVGYEPSTAVGEDDTLYMALRRGVLVFAQGKGPAKLEQLGGRPSAIAVDESGRLWAAVEGRVVIVHPDGKRTKWQAGAFPELADEIEHITVVGAGPTLPAAAEPVTGTVTGKVLIDGQTEPGAIVAVCANPLLAGYQDHPCEKGDPHVATKTAADGTFSLRGVPSGTYYIAAGKAKRWSMKQYNLAVQKTGASTSIGTIEIK